MLALVQDSLRYAQERNRDLQNQLSNEAAVDRNRTNCLNDRTQQLHAKTSYLNDILQTTKHNGIRLDQERNQVNGLTIESKRLKDNE